MWAERFCRFVDSGADAGPERAPLRVLERLKHDGRTADWHVRQADDAVKLYLWNYRVDRAKAGLMLRLICASVAVNGQQLEGIVLDGKLLAGRGAESLAARFRAQPG